MQDRPTSEELLATIADLLEAEVMPALQGPLRHQVRVAGNLCRILGREAGLGAAQDARERQLLAELLGEEESGRAAVDLSRSLVERLAGPRDAELERRAWRALVEIVRGKLAVAKPGHDAYDFEAELD